jgi:beta-fructofuranosidase
VLQLPSSWVWDYWLADDGEQYHLYFLKASRALLDPNRRHWRATVGHAISTDLREWTEVADALVPSDGPAFDDLATWTGSVVKAPDGTWRMYYTGVDRAHRGQVQRIGAASSKDLYTWERTGTEPVTAPDGRWYELLSSGEWKDEAWRDPWVFADPDGNGWHMLITARSRHGESIQRGVVGHAWSRDLASWTVEPPLSTPGSGFGQLEVLQVEAVEGRPVLIFSCESAELAPGVHAEAHSGGIWAVNLDKLTGPIDITAAYRIHDESLYVGRLIQDRCGHWKMLAFRNHQADGTFGGFIVDPLHVSWGDDGRLHLD